eukprot:TRINITY_DN44502_c0_g1_i1.p1 TRINITY_DN44502_c0_g1~~TRINITY_DN44502_c0_g1_i1.p1  ORF type:complete len:427 (+),score=45.11 TRINITY_DN44502_c0_g1_i1:79-1281(+)
MGVFGIPAHFVVGLLFAASPVHAWIDNGHALVAEVAKQELGDDLSARISKAISRLSGDPVDQDWDIISAAVWPDRIKCTSSSSFCPVPPDGVYAINQFDAWHYSDRPYIPDGEDKNLTLVARWMQENFDTNPSSADFMSSTARTFRTPATDLFSWAFLLRMTVHIIGDMHQPLHNAEGFFDNDPNFGTLREGDRGGNLIKLKGDWNNLHLFWDAACGLYHEVLDVPVPRALSRALSANASSLRGSFPRQDFVRKGMLPREPRSIDNYSSSVFRDWVIEASGLAGSVSYVGIQKDSTPSSNYTQLCQTTSRSQITLGGYRLADFLRAAAEHLPPPPEDPTLDTELMLAILLGLVTAALFGVVIAWFVTDRRRSRARAAVPLVTSASGPAGEQQPLYGSTIV